MTIPLEETLERTSIYLPAMARILAIRSLTQMEKLFTLELPQGMRLNHDPGQFVEVSILGVGEAPISISSSPGRSEGSFELCIRRVGDLTNALHDLEVGERIGIRGPFGKGFPTHRFHGKDILFAPGGLGLAPLRSLINQVLDERHSYGRAIILYGARSPSELLFADELAAWADREDVELHLTVDQAGAGWTGNVGVITTLFPKIQIHARDTIAVTVGPPVMYRFVLVELLSKGIPEGNIWLGLERRMKCGVGICGHCQIGHVYTCQDGRSFCYRDIKHLEGAL